MLAGRGNGEDLQQIGDCFALVIGGEGEAEAGLALVQGVDAGVDLYALIAVIEGQQAFPTGRDIAIEGTAEAGFAEVRAGAKDNGGAVDEVHATVCRESGRAVEEAAQWAHRKRLDRVSSGLLYGLDAQARIMDDSDHLTD